MARDASSSTQMRIAARPPLSVESVVDADIATVGNGPTDRSSPPQAGFFRVRRDETVCQDADRTLRIVQSKCPRELIVAHLPLSLASK
jgi:hypothetical protein